MIKCEKKFHQGRNYGYMGAPEQLRRAIQNNKESHSKAFQTLNEKLLLSGENAHLPKMLVWVQSIQDQLF
jgi:hypothetical protein